MAIYLNLGADGDAPTDSMDTPGYTGTRGFDPSEALHDNIRQAQDLTDFNTAIQQRDALYRSRQQAMAESPDAYNNLHPKDFMAAFHRDADEDDRAVLSDSPSSIRPHLEIELRRERIHAFDRAFTTYRRQFLDYQDAALVRDKAFYLSRAAGAASEQERDANLHALAGRYAASAQAGIIHVATAKDAIANIPADYDAALFDRDFQIDPARARDNLASGQYPNIGPEKRTELARAADEALGQLSQEAVQPGEEDFPEPHDGGPATPDQGQAQNGDQGGPRDQERQDQNQAAQETAESKRGAAPRANEKPNPQQQPSEKPAASNEPSKNEKKEGGLSLMAVKDIISKLNVSEETKARLIKLAELGYMMDAEGAGKYTGPYNGPRAPAVADRIKDYIKGAQEGKIPEKSAAANIAKDAVKSEKTKTPQKTEEKYVAASEVNRPGSGNVGEGPGAMKRHVYEPSPKHGTEARGSNKGEISPAPKNGQEALDVSIQVSPNSPRRVGIDYRSATVKNFLSFFSRYWR